MYRGSGRSLELLLVHPGGPFWAKKDHGSWSIPKGEYEQGEDSLDVARREFEEELGVKPEGRLLPLGRIRQKGGKQVEAFALEGELDPATIVSNHFTLEWPPRSGRFQSWPELDRAGWFTLAQAREKILPSQAALLDLLTQKLGIVAAPEGG